MINRTKEFSSVMFLFYFIVSKLGKQVLERHMLFFYYIGTIFKRKTILICHPFPDLPLKKMMLPSILGSVSCLPVTLLFTVLQKDTVPSPHPPPHQNLSYHQAVEPVAGVVILEIVRARHISCYNPARCPQGWHRAASAYSSSVWSMLAPKAGSHC